MGVKETGVFRDCGNGDRGEGEEICRTFGGTVGDGGTTV